MLSNLYVYFSISMFMTLVSIFLGVKAFLKKSNLSVSLCGICISAAVMTYFYLSCIIAEDYTLFSIASSCYFYSVDVLVVFVFAFAMHYTKTGMGKINRIAIHFVHTLCLIDFIILFGNIFNDFAISYREVPGSLLGYEYEMHLGYYYHLLFDYSVLAVAFYRFIKKMLSLPFEYKKPYFYIVGGIIVVVIINALWLFIPASHIWSDLDYSVWGFGIATAFLYWTAFIYKRYQLPSNFSNAIVESIDQGIVLFDLDGNIIIKNKRAEQLIPEQLLLPNITEKEFAEGCGIQISRFENMKLFSSQVVFESMNNPTPMRCDCHVMENKKHRVLGRLFVFSDTKSGIDLLTGFHTVESFEQIAKDRKEVFSGHITVVIMDMIGLKIINYNQGRLAGDEKIRQLSTAMREVFPRGTFFVRGQDANLIAICRDLSEDDAKECAEKARDMFDGNAQYAISSVKDNSDITDLIVGAERTLRARKLMDKQSKHSEVLTSMLVALQECDPDTEKHVERTQEMGSELGKKIGLGEVEISDLSLLCILHDIGKIGIPLEILNKPAKLTDAEWVIMRSHVEKGYQITSSNQEFAAIAKMVRYHHERWDGKGYPDGLKGEEIPQLSRIISIVDAYDAMVNDRIYRPAMDPHDAQAEILKCAGSQFDPYIAQAFVDMLQEPKFLAISKEISEKVILRKAEKERRSKVLREKLESERNTTDNIGTMSYSRVIMKSDGLLIEANDEFFQLTGYVQADLNKGDIYLSNLLFDEDFREYVDKVSSKVRKGNAVYFKCRLRAKDGGDLKVVCLAKLFYDSTKKSELGEFLILESK